MKLKPRARREDYLATLKRPTWLLPFAVLVVVIYLVGWGQLKADRYRWAG